MKSCLKVTVESVENEQPNGCGLAGYFWELEGMSGSVFDD